MRQLLLAVVTTALVAAPAQAQTQGISVDGSASRQVPNDTGRFSATVTAKRRTATAALAATARATRRVLAAERALGIARPDIRTSSVTVSRVFRRDRRTRRLRLVGHEARNRIRVTVRDLSLAGRAIDAAVAAGASSISSLTLFADDTDAVYREVLGEAFDDARAKAELLAARAGVTLGPAVFIDEGGDQSFDDFAFREGAASPEQADAPTPVRPGESTVRAFVSVLFQTS
jgi:uncharacterized protein YggE